MGNTNAKESRSGDPGASSSSSRHHRSSIAPALDPSASNERHRSSSRIRNRASRNDISTLLGIGPSSSSSRADRDRDPPHERRETRAERESRRLERERIQRVKERERSIKEESVDGGYLVTMGVYVGQEDFNKQIVRQLMVRYSSCFCCTTGTAGSPAQPDLSGHILTAHP